jgi:hypothetical protein
MENINTNSINIIEIIRKQKEELKNNKVCKYCRVKISCRNVCTKCTMAIANYKLSQQGYFKKYYESHKKNKPVEELKKRGRKPKKIVNEDLEVKN